MSEAAFTQALKEYESAQIREALGVNPVNELSPFVGVGIHDAKEEAAEDTVSPAPIFPLEVMPVPLQTFIQDAADALPVPVDLIAGPVLACLGSAIGAHRQVRL